MYPTISHARYSRLTRNRLTVAILLVGLCGAAGYLAQVRLENPEPAMINPRPIATDTDCASAVPEIPVIVGYSSPEQIQFTLESIQALAARDHRSALTLALAAHEPQLRDDRLQAVLRGWAGTNANAAANWARDQSFLETSQAFSAVFNGANQNPDEVVRLAGRLSKEDPENAASYDSYLIFALGHVEKFELAATVAANSAIDSRTSLLSAAYGNWAERQTEQALAAATKLKDPEMQHTAIRGIFSGWAKTEPEELTEIAMNLAPGPDRAFALTTALRAWIEKDPAAVADWLPRHKFTPEMEAALEE